MYFSYDQDGKHTGEAYVRLSSDNDKQEALNFNMGALEKRFIEVFETTESEWL